jgi:hypothetical protein
MSVVGQLLVGRVLLRSAVAGAALSFGASAGSALYQKVSRDGPRYMRRMRRARSKQTPYPAVRCEEMSMEQQKILEMVASGKITPEDGVRLLNALGGSAQAEGSRKGPTFEIPDLKLPKIELGDLGEMYVELKNSMTDAARKVTGKFQESKASKYFEPKEYDFEGPAAAGVASCSLSLDISAGKFKLKSGDSGKLIYGRCKRVPTEPELDASVEGGAATVSLKHSMGRCLTHVATGPGYTINLANAASDATLELEDLRVEALNVENNAGNVHIHVGEESWQPKVNVSSNAGHVRLRLPGGHALKINVNSTLSGHNFEQLGLKINEGSAQSADWEHNERRVELTLSQNLAAFELIWKRAKGEGLLKVIPQGETEAAAQASED